MRTINRLALEPMSVVDTAWLRMDSRENLMVINGLLVFEEPMARSDFKAVLEERLVPQHKRFRQRAHIDGNRYFWEELPQLDMDYHFTDLADVPACCDDAEMRAAIDQLLTSPLDNDKPLWRFYWVPHFKQGSAVVIRVHHSYADGVALISVLDSIADYSVLHSSPAARFKMPQRQAKSAALPDRVTFLLSSLVFYLGFSLAWLYEALRVVLVKADTKTAYKQALTMEKRVAWAPSLPVHSVKEVGKALGCTMNDVILGCVAGSLRRYLEQVGEPVSGIQMRATIPVNLRPLEEALQLGNRFGLVYLELPVSESTVKRRIHAVHRNMASLKSGVQALMSFHILGILGFLPKAVENFFLNFFSSKASAVMTNVPGPCEPVYLKGKKVSKPMFWVPQSGAIGIGVSILSYDNKVEFGFVADAALIPDPQIMIDAFVQEFAEIRREVLGDVSVVDGVSQI